MTTTQPEQNKEGQKQATAALRAEQQLAASRCTYRRHRATDLPGPSAPRPNGGDYWVREGTSWLRTHVKPRTVTDDGPDISKLTPSMSTMLLNQHLENASTGLMTSKQLMGTMSIYPWHTTKRTVAAPSSMPLPRTPGTTPTQVSEMSAQTLEIKETLDAPTREVQQSLSIPAYQQKDKLSQTHRWQHHQQHTEDDKQY